MFERPATAFVARFIGGHNVLSTPDGPVAVRADRCRLGAGAGAMSMAGTAASVEYLGPHVRVQIATPDGQEAAALIPAHAFFAAPVALGDPVVLSWAATDARPLAA